MTSLAQTLGRDVVSRTSAENLGPLGGAVLDVPSRRIVAWQVGSGRRALVAPHAAVHGIGAAAIVVEDEASLHPPADPAEVATAKGDRPLLSARVLTDAGEEIGPVEDVEFDPDSGAVLTVTVPGGQIPAERMHGLGSFALVVATA
jgi:uncharacterized protein YrrD